MNKTFFITICFIFILASCESPLRASAHEIRTRVGAGYFTSTSDEAAVMLVRSDLEWGDFSMAFDILGLAGERKPDGLDTVVLRELEYHTGKFGLGYREIKDQTFGQGLLVSNYSPWSRGPAFLSNKAGGVSGYYDGDIVSFDVFGTWSHVYGMRIEQDLYPYFVLGQTFAADVDGYILNKPGGGLQEIGRVSGYGFDFKTQIFEDTNFFAEAAKLEDRGSAYSLGILFERDRVFLNTSFSVERRFLGEDFIPGYFDPFTENCPIDPALFDADRTRKDGYRLNFSTLLLGFIDLNLGLQTFDVSEPAFDGQFRLWAIRGVYLRGYFREPSLRRLRSLDLQDAKIIGGSLSFDIGPSLTVSSHYKKTADPDEGRVEETIFAELGFNF